MRNNFDGYNYIHLLLSLITVIVMLSWWVNPITYLPLGWKIVQVVLAGIPISAMVWHTAKKIFDWQPILIFAIIIMIICTIGSQATVLMK